MYKDAIPQLSALCNSARDRSTPPEKLRNNIGFGKLKRPAVYAALTRLYFDSVHVQHPGSPSC